MVNRRGFTLVEVIMVLSIVLVLAAMILPTFKNFRQKTDRLVAASHMRQIGQALFQYVGDQNGRLPGPMKSGQGPQYVPDKPDQLASVLGPYLGVTEGNEKMLLKVFISPVFARAMAGQNLENTHPFLMNISPPIGIKPWGSEAPPLASPMMLHALPMTMWAFCDADQLNPGVIGQPWVSKTPPYIVNGTKRLALYFDGRVGPIENFQLMSSSPPPPAPAPAPPPPG